MLKMFFKCYKDIDNCNVHLFFPDNHLTLKGRLNDFTKLI